VRLTALARNVRVEELPGDWWYEEFEPAGWHETVRSEAVALVNDGEIWSQLVPVRVGDAPSLRLRLWRVVFPPDLDNSGFVGWLATRIKQRTGSGVVVVCGQSRLRGGIYDLWGCPVDAGAAVAAEIEALVAGPERERRAPAELSFAGLRMRAVATASGGEVDRDTLFVFGQDGSTVWARYAGGNVRLGYLAGTLLGRRLEFRYAQVDRTGRVDGGVSACDVEVLPDARMRLLEHFTWASRAGSGTNVLEEVRAS